MGQFDPLEFLEYVEKQNLDVVRYCIGTDLEGVRMAAGVASVKAVPQLFLHILANDRQGDHPLQEIRLAHPP